MDRQLLIWIKSAENTANSFHYLHRDYLGSILALSNSDGEGSVISGGKFWDGFRNGAISSSLNHVVHILQKSLQQDPLKQHMEKAVTLEEWVERYGDWTQEEIALEAGRDEFGLPLGPDEKYRYVINPYDGNVMDMRHVVVVGYGMGEVLGLGAEIIQKVAGYFGHDQQNSAFNPQDRYSNNIGASFHTYDFRTNGLGMSFNFGNRFNQFLSKVYKR